MTKGLLLRLWLLALYIGIIGVSCSNQPREISLPLDRAMLKNISHESWVRLKTATILLGHQSVGGNILKGIVACTDSFPERTLNIIHLEDSTRVSGPGLYHCYVGENEKPFTKIEDFKKQIDRAAGDTLGAAFFKFCFIDFNAATDVNALFKQYKEVMDTIAHHNPSMRLFHCTVPLTTISRGIKPLLKKMLGKSSGNEATIKREEFNQLIRSTYGAQNTVFDLAAFESTYPDGSRESFTRNGVKAYGLIPLYSSDGGHLNSAGQIHCAIALLSFLARNF